MVDTGDEGSPGSLIVQLNTFNRFEWFTREFAAADGWKWLEQRLRLGSWSATVCFDLIRFSTAPIVRHEDLRDWVTLTRKLLVLCGDMRGAFTDARDEKSRSGPSEKSLKELATTFQEILRQQEERRKGLEPTPEKFDPKIAPWVSSSSFVDSSAHLLYPHADHPY